MRLILVFLALFVSLHSCDPYLVILVDAPHLDLSSNQRFLRCLTKHPDTGSKRCDVGHAWILLHGELNGKCVELEGGHSGELGIAQPRYFDGMMDRLEKGDPNPAKYLWSIQKDGFFQKGSGDHDPTYAIAKKITSTEFQQILNIIHFYDFAHYAITQNQCTTFVKEVARIVGWNFDSRATLQIEQNVNGWRLWSDAKYQFLQFGSPDKLECEMISLVENGSAKEVTHWYRRHHGPSIRKKCRRVCSAFIRFPSRISRHLAFR